MNILILNLEDGGQLDKVSISIATSFDIPLLMCSSKLGFQPHEADDQAHVSRVR